LALIDFRVCNATIALLFVRMLDIRISFLVRRFAPLVFHPFGQMGCHSEHCDQRITPPVRHPFSDAGHE
jgi:hypothetical protein